MDRLYFPNPMERKSTKRIISEVVLEKLPNTGQTIDNVTFQWWMSGRQDGLRLTELGDKSFRAANIESFSHPLEVINASSWYSFLLDLSKKMKCPYYIGTKDGENFIRLFDSKIAMLVTLYGTFQEYLDSVKIRK
jgi:hypothetical protein